MAFKKKSRKPLVYLAIILVAILVIAVASIVYVTNQSSPSAPKSVVPGLHVGDTFFYKITGYCNANPDSVNPDFGLYNNTAYYEVTITGVTGSVVYLNSDWKLTNGTLIQNSAWINLENGNYSGSFWYIYPPNLNANNLLYPEEQNTALIVNATSTQTFADSTRPSNYWSGDDVLYNSNDPTGSTQEYDFIQVGFDTQTGIMISLINIQEYNNPPLDLQINWQLTNSSLWVI
jgi:hypothetical protein